MLAWIPIALAVLAGVGIGLVSGGQMGNLTRWRPDRWQLGVGGLTLQVLIRVTSLSGWLAVLVELISAGALIAFCVLNVRLGGMIMIVIGLSMNVIPIVVNWGMPVSRSAVISAGLVEGGSLAATEIAGPRHLADEGDHLIFLSEIIAIPPTSQVISVGDVVLLIGFALTISALLRNRFVSSDSRRGSRGGIPYQEAIAALGEGPAPRRGPGTHPAKQITRPPEAETGVRRLPPED